MCGICGVFDRSGQPADPALVERMADAMRHRGPDGAGRLVQGSIGLGHRRLSIIDVEGGAQPISNEDGSVQVVFNGEIYNYIEIRAELIKRGCRFVSDSDSEVILAAYSVWGEECLARFNGMWAFAIFDAQERTLFLARDRFGVKPLYYVEDARQFAFGSEIKQLLCLQPVVRANQLMVIESMLTYIDGHTSQTFFDGVMCLPQGHSLTYRLATHDYQIKRWYRLELRSELARLSAAEAAEQFRETFADAVRIRLRSDVIVGTCLSGGLDSSATSALAAAIYRKASGQRFTAVHAKSIEQATDESRHARTVAQHCDLDLHIVEPTLADFVATIDEVVYTQEEPFGSPSMFMGWHVFREARANNCKVMLNGQGGDEVLLGYERYFAALLHSMSLAGFLRELRLQSRNSSLRPLDVLMYYVYFTNPTLRIQRLKRRSLLRASIKDTHDFEYVRRSAESFRKLDEMQIFEISTLQLPHLLRYEDRNSMRHSVETRLPFLDYRVVELGVSLPPQYKIRDGWTKHVLRKAVADVLPEQIVWRRDKLGFQAPEKTWLGARRQQMREEVARSAMLAQITDRDSLLQRFDQLSLKDQWQYFNLAAWERIYKVQWA
jgi:asparagine synthase (glutamine-hydrolysing)